MDTRSRRCYRRRFLVRHAAGSLNRSSVIAKSMTGAIVVPKILTERVESLEKAVESLRELPVRVTRLEEQVLQLRSEMRVLHEDLTHLLFEHAT
jgi:chaperonin cofactor prefoldin